MSTFSLEQVLKISMDNLKRMSRTANGILDVSSRATKKDDMMTSDADLAAQKVAENFPEAIRYCYDNKDRSFTSKKDLQRFLECVAQKVNKDIVKPDKLFRSGQDSSAYRYTFIKDLPAEYDWFCNELYRFCSDKDTDTIWLAAFAEYYINLRLHVFSDGCGKISMAFAAYLCMRGGLLPVQYDSREAYYQYGPRSIVHVGSPEDLACFSQFYKYYKKLAEHRNDCASL